jgi:rhamnosyltransferase
MISLIIPTLNAEKYLLKLLPALLRQKKADQSPYGAELEILVVDSGSEDRTVSLAEECGAKILKVDRADFDHGGTRNLAWRAAKGEYIFFLTQDALPVNEGYLEEFLQYFRRYGESLVMVSGRQVPYADARPVERLTRSFNYPPESNIRTAADIGRLGIKAFFFSDACAAYRRSFLEEMGGFESPILTNEDMLMAARALKKGCQVGYCAGAQVYHSHNFTLRQQYRRNFDVGAFLAMYQNEVASGSAAGEGIRMVMYTERKLLKGLHFASMVRCIFESAAKFLGNRAGKQYQGMSLEKILKKTSNPAFWRKNGV